MPPMRLSELHKALADDTRLRIVRVLSRATFSVQELTAILGLAQPTVSHHLKILAAAGLVISRREGTWSFYSLASGAESGVADLITEVRRLLEQHPPERSEQDLNSVQDTLRERQSKSLSYFEQVAPEWSAERERQFSEPIPVDQIVSGLSKTDTVAELGCGSGNLLGELAPHCKELIGVDYSPAMLEQARKKLSTRSTEVELRLGSLEHLPLGDSSIDCAVACMVFHHLSHPPQALADTFRILRPGGRLVVVDLAKHSDETMRERFADLWLGFEIAEFRSWVELAGFKNIVVEQINPHKRVFVLKAEK